jgi:hypothetical protein
MTTAERLRWTAAHLTRPGLTKDASAAHELTACEGLDAWKDD